PARQHILHAAHHPAPTTLHPPPPHDALPILLISATIPSSTGYSTQWQNIGQTSNKGIEIAVTGDIIQKKDFTLSASFNISFNRRSEEHTSELQSRETRVCRLRLEKTNAEWRR